jgi:molybdopterin-guanine dinucleotide biosynthesis protein A
VQVANARSKRPKSPKLEICILAGGLSTRMGRDKSRVRLGRDTMLRQVKTVAASTGFKVRIIRRDIVPRSGPIGGIYSALETTDADAVIFLACDMPFITPEILTKLAAVGSTSPELAVFFKSGGKLSFPFLIPRQHAGRIALRLQSGDFSIQSLRRYLPNKVAPCPAKWLQYFENINTPADLARARNRFLAAAASRQRVHPVPAAARRRNARAPTK